jgi:cysteine desulfurase
LANDLVAKCGAKGVLFSAGAACHAGSQVPSKTLKALHIADALAIRTLRLSTGISTSEQQVQRAVEVIKEETSEKKKKKSE